MSVEQRVTITVKDTGEITWDDGGFKGTTCSKEAQKLMQAIGGAVVAILIAGGAYLYYRAIKKY